MNIFIRNFVLCIQIRFVSTEKTTRIASRASCYLWSAIRLRNHIFSTCINMTIDNLNTCFDYKLAFYRYRYNIEMYTNTNSSIKLLMQVISVMNKLQL